MSWCRIICIFQREAALCLEEESHKPVTQALTHHPEKDMKCVCISTWCSEFVLEIREGRTTFSSHCTKLGVSFNLEGEVAATGSVYNNHK